MKKNHWIVFENQHDYELEKAKKKEEESLYEIKKEETKVSK